ncbi:MAG: HlyD family efflux transporter periplasmic adaptor subunit [Planctomycetes bacterium]|nr:HlyD family efflux transporter periplasmic adaptor subunit [Planctomycetota bacterium]
MRLRNRLQSLVGQTIVRRRIVCGLLAAITLGGFCTGCGKKDDAAADGGKPKGRPPTLIRVKAVTRISLAPQVVVVGTVTATRRNGVIASGANGVVQRSDVEQGQWVSKGDVLSQLRMVSSEHEMAEARSVLAERFQLWKESQTSRAEDVAEAYAKMIAARRTRDRSQRRADQLKNLLEKKSINQDEYDDARERYQVAEALCQAAESVYQRVKAGPRLEKREQAKSRYQAQLHHVAYLETEQTKRTTRAPFSGYIVSEHTYVGQWLSKGDPVVTMVMLDNVDVLVNIDQEDLQHVQLGRTADVRIAGYELTSLKRLSGETLTGLIRRESRYSIEIEDEAGRLKKISKSDIQERRTIPWQGTIVQIVPQSDWQKGSRGFPVKVRIRNRFRTVLIPAKDPKQPPTGRRLPVLKEGMMATVIFQGEKSPVLLVPKDALVRTTQGFKVNLFLPSKSNAEMGSTRQIVVTTGISRGDRIQVRLKPDGSGKPPTFEAGTLVVTEGGERLLPLHGNVKIAPEPTAAKKRGR